MRRFPFGSLLRNRARVRRIIPGEGLQSTKAINFQLKKKKKKNKNKNKKNPPSKPL
jgi:hypothetical protein